MDGYEVRAVHVAAGDGLFRHGHEHGRGEDAPVHPMDSHEARKTLRKLLAWLAEERELQAENRLEMAIDADFYDGFQWKPEDAAQVRERGQMPLVFNEIAPMIDWMIGTERRARVDSRVLPRAPDDVQLADIKTQVMKYFSDVNGAQFVRSQAFSEAVKCGLSWIEDGIRDDYTKERIFKAHESWRNVLHDSRAVRSMDMSGCRYLFRWRDVDEDLAIAMFPDRAEQLKQAASDYAALAAEDEELDGWGAPLDAWGKHSRWRGGALMGACGTSRRVVRLYECQWRVPERVQVVESGAWRGAALSQFDPVLQQAVQDDPSLGVVDKLTMRMHIALFVPNAMLAMGRAPWRHNDFSLTPVWCYRRSRDGMPYGMVRRVRDLQLDLNKRASKAAFLINTNQIIASEDATDDWEQLRDEASRPDGVLIKRRGTELLLRRDEAQAAGQLNLMAGHAQAIQRAGGVANENLGRQTNAVSGEAIKARQIQGSVVTTEPFDNLRFAVQTSGSKELSLIEQFVTEERVLRLLGSRGKIEWQKINEPVLYADGSVRILNDITASRADFVVSDQDWAGTLRQVMFDSLNALAQRVPPDVGLRLLTMAFDYSDLPNHEEIADAFRRVTGERDPNKELTPEEQQQEMQAQQAQAEALELQREDARLAVEERRAKVRELMARASELEAQAQQLHNGDSVQQQVSIARAKAAEEMEQVSRQLVRALGEIARLRAQAAGDVQRAQIAAQASIQVAQIRSGSDARLGAVREGLEAAAQQAGIGAPVPQDGVEGGDVLPQDGENNAIQ